MSVSVLARTASAAALLATTLVFSAPAADASIQMSYGSGGLFNGTGNRAVTLNSPNNLINDGNASNDGNPLRVAAGGFNLKADSPFDPGVAFERFTAWCLDITRVLSVKNGSPYEVTADPFTGGPTLDLTMKADIESLFETSYHGLFNVANGARRDNSAAFQIALWEIINEDDGPYNVTNGSFNVSNVSQDVIDLANGFLGGLDGSISQSYRLVFLESIDDEPRSQNLVTVAAVPLPAAGLLMLAALAGGAAVYRRRKVA